MQKLAQKSEQFELKILKQIADFEKDHNVIVLFGRKDGKHKITVVVDVD